MKKYYVCVCEWGTEKLIVQYEEFTFSDVCSSENQNQKHPIHSVTESQSSISLCPCLLARNQFELNKKAPGESTAISFPQHHDILDGKKK